MQIVPVIIFKGNIVRGQEDDSIIISGNSQNVQVTYLIKTDAKTFDTNGNPIFRPFDGEKVSITFWDEKCLENKDLNGENSLTLSDLTKKCAGSFEGQMDAPITYASADCPLVEKATDRYRCDYTNSLKKMFGQSGCFFSGTCLNCEGLLSCEAIVGQEACKNCLGNCQWENNECKKASTYYEGPDCSNCLLNTPCTKEVCEKISTNCKFENN